MISVYSVGVVVGVAVGSAAGAAVIFAIILIVVIVCRQAHLLLHNASTRNVVKVHHVGTYSVIFCCLQRHY